MDDVINFTRYVGAFNNIARTAFGTDYKNGEIKTNGPDHYSFTEVSNEYLAVFLSDMGTCHFVVAPPGCNDLTNASLFVDPPMSLLEDPAVINRVISVAGEIGDIADVREITLEREFWPYISKNGINLPPGWDFTDSLNGEVHLERG